MISSSWEIQICVRIISFSSSREENNIDDRHTLNVQMIAMILWWLPWSCDDCHDLLMIAMMIAMILWWWWPLPHSSNFWQLSKLFHRRHTSSHSSTSCLHLSYCHIVVEQHEVKSLCIHVFWIVCLQQFPHFTFPVFQSQRFLAVLQNRTSENSIFLLSSLAFLCLELSPESHNIEFSAIPLKHQIS